MARRELSPRLRDLFGPSAGVSAGADGTPVVAPETEAAAALLLRTASLEGWRVRVQGAGGWMPPDAPADVAFSTERLTKLVDVTPADLVATAEAGITWGDLRRGLADHGAWLALDVPGAHRTLGSVLATATAGPLRAGYGPLRDHVLGLTLVTGDGRVVRVGGRVVKNVAGYDLGKLAAGSFGAFGVITAVHLRLRAVPRADLTLTADGRRDDLLATAHRVMDAGLTPAALELISPAAAGDAAWRLCVRLLGTDEEVAAERDAVHGVVEAPLTEHAGAGAADLWTTLLAGAAAAPVTLRLGATPRDLADALDLVAHRMDEAVRDWIAVTVPAGTVRWSGQAAAEAIARLRSAAAAREWPVTLERAPWAIRVAVGHFGAYREGVARLTAGLRNVFDPARALVTPLEGGGA